MSEGSDDLECGSGGEAGSHLGWRAQVFPQKRVTNLGRRVGVDRDREPERFVFTYQDDVVAELHHPASTADATEGALLGWRMTFPTSGDRMLAAPAGDPPIGPALFFVDIALRDQS